jgi:hypothetical protein
MSLREPLLFIGAGCAAGLFTGRDTALGMAFFAAANACLIYGFTAAFKGSTGAARRPAAIGLAGVWLVAAGHIATPFDVPAAVQVGLALLSVAGTLMIARYFFACARMCKECGLAAVGRWWRRAAVSRAVVFGGSGMAAAIFGAVYGFPSSGSKIDLQEAAGLLALPLFALVVWTLISPLIAAYLFTQATAPRTRCIRCGYSLLGLKARLCPECGSPFNAAHIRGGEAPSRPPVRSLVGSQVAVLVLLTFAALACLPGNGLQRFKPLSMLVREATSPSGITRARAHEYPTLNLASSPGEGPAGDAQREILRRITAGLITPPAAAALADHILRAQHDLGVRWEMWPDIFDALTDASFVTPEQRERFFTGSLHFTPVFRSPIASGRPFELHIVGTWRGVGFSSKTYATMDQCSQTLELSVASVEIDGRAIAHNLSHRRYSVGQGGKTAEWRFSAVGGVGPAETMVVEAGPGMHDLRVKVDARWNAAPPAFSSWKTSADLTRLKLPLNWAVTAAAEMRVLPADAHTVIHVAEPESLKSFLEDVEFQVFYHNGTWIFASPKPGTVQVGRTPLSFVFRCFIRTDGGDVPIGRFLGYSGGQLDMDVRLPPEIVLPYTSDEQTAHASYRLILRPEPDLAESLPDVDRVYSGPDIVVLVPSR